MPLKLRGSNQLCLCYLIRVSKQESIRQKVYNNFLPLSKAKFVYWEIALFQARVLLHPVTFSGQVCLFQTTAARESLSGALSNFGEGQICAKICKNGRRMVHFANEKGCAAIQYIITRIWWMELTRLVVVAAAAITAATTTTAAVVASNNQ